VFARNRETEWNCNASSYSHSVHGRDITRLLSSAHNSLTQCTDEIEHLSGNGNLGLLKSRSFTALDDQRPLERNAIYHFVYVSGDVQSHQTMPLYKSLAVSTGLKSAGLPFLRYK
jgi:hypothetical protein